MDGYNFSFLFGKSVFPIMDKLRCCDSIIQGIFRPRMYCGSEQFSQRAQ